MGTKIKKTFALFKQTYNKYFILYIYDSTELI